MATTHYTATEGCDENCLHLIVANYRATATPPGFTLGDALDYAELVRTRYINDVGTHTTPIITSGWRNPERNERVSTSRNSDHQNGRAIDLKPEDNQQLFPVIYTTSNRNAAATTWCQLAASAHTTGGATQVLIENTRGKPTGAATYYDYYHLDPVLATCISDVRTAIEACIPLVTNPDPDVKHEVCSPNHVHTAR